MGVYHLPARDETWRAMSPGMPVPADVLAVTTVGGRVVAGTPRGEFVAWADTTWKVIRSFGDAARTARASAVRVIWLERGGLLVGSGDGLWESDEAGSWTRVWNGKDVNTLADLSSGKLLVGTMGSGLFLREDATRFAAVASYPGAKTIAGLAETTIPAPGVLVAAEGDGVHFTRDGKHFERLDLGVPNPLPTAIFADDDGIAVALDGVGLAFRTAATPRWTTIRCSLRITAVARCDGRLVFGTDGLGVMVVEGGRAKPLGKGLLNFPEAVIRDALAPAAGPR
jgi:hypothetical protein